MMTSARETAAEASNGWLKAFGLLSLSLIVIQVADALSGSYLTEALQNSFDAVWSGEWWRLLSGQFLHLDMQHLLIDVACILGMGVLLRGSPAPWLVLGVFVVGGVAGQLFGALAWRWGLTEYASLVGSSDGVHGLIYLFVAREYRQAADWRGRAAWIVGACLLLASTIYTCTTGQMAFASTLKSPGYNHFGGILVFLIAVESGLLAVQGNRPPACQKQKI